MIVRTLAHFSLVEFLWIFMLSPMIMFPSKIIAGEWHWVVVLLLLLPWLIRLSLASILKFGGSVSRFANRSSGYREFQDKESQQTEIIATPLNGVIYLLMLWLPVTLWASAASDVSWEAVGYLLFGISLFWACINMQLFYKSPQFLIVALLVVGILLTLASPFLVEIKPLQLFQLPIYDFLQTSPLKFGETIHLNVLAGVLVLVLPFGLVFLWPSGAEIAGRLRVVLIPVTVLLALTLVLTQSRGGYLAIIAALLLMVTLQHNRLLYLMPMIALLIWGLFSYLGQATLLDLISSDGSVSGWDGRLIIWTQSLNLLQNFAITGIGIGSFAVAMPALYPLRINVESYPHAHSLWLQVGLDLGIPGLILYIALLINLIAMLIVVIRSPRATPAQYLFAVGAAGSLAGMLTHGLLDAVIWGTKLSFLPWLLFALITQLFLRVAAAGMPQRLTRESP